MKPQRGDAKDITLELSGCIEDSSGFVLSDLRYMREGIPFLGPDERIRCLWNHIDRLIPYLRERRLQEGAAVKVSYKGLPGEAYATEWRIAPLLYEGLRYDASQLPRDPADPLPRKEVLAEAKGERAGESSGSAGDEDGRQGN